MPAKKTVYDLSGDEPKALERYSIVADELVASDPARYSFEPHKSKPAEKPAAPKKK